DEVDRAFIDSVALGPRIARLGGEYFDQVEAIELLLLRQPSKADRKQPQHLLAVLADAGAADRLFVLFTLLRKSLDENARAKAYVLSHGASPPSDERWSWHERRAPERRRSDDTR